jgi:oligopeptide transport system substrate-binding protein
MPGSGRARPRRPDGRILAIVLCCALLAVGCTHRSTRSGEPGAATPRTGGTLRIALVTPASLDPAQATSAEQRLLVGNLFDSLTTLDADGAVRPAAAASWSSDQTLRHWRFQLRPGARYADGQPVQARDFKSAWERLASPRTRPRPATAAGLLGLVKGYQAMATGRSRSISGLSVPDPATLAVDLNEPFADFPTVVADPRLSPIPPNAMARGAAAFAARPVGNGPFTLAKPQRGQTIDLVRNPRYAGRAAYLDRVRVQVVPDQQTAWLAFQHGQVSFAPVPPDQVPAARLVAGASGDGRGRPGLLQGPELGVWSIGFDPHGQQGSDARWRRAVSLALDREGIAAALQGAVAPAAGIAPAGVRGARQDPCPSCRYDPGQAGALLDLIGDGARKPVVLAVAANDFDREVAATVKQQLAKVGLPVKVEELSGRLSSSAGAGAQLDGFGQAADFPRMDPFLAGLPDRRVQDLVTQARATADQADRTRLYQQAEQAALDTAAVAPVVRYQHTAALAPGVEGFDLTPWGSVDLSTCSLANWAK